MKGCPNCGEYGEIVVDIVHVGKETPVLNKVTFCTSCQIVDCEGKGEGQIEE